MNTPPTIIVKHQNTEGPISSCISSCCCSIVALVALLLLIAGCTTVF